MSTIESAINSYIDEHLDEKLPQLVSEKLKQIQPPRLDDGEAAR